MNTTETNRSVAEQFNEAFNRGDLNAAAACFAEDCRNHGRPVGRAGVRKVLAEIKTNFPDARLTTLNSVAEGEWVVVRCTYTGTHLGTSSLPVDGGMLVGVPPTARLVDSVQLNFVSDFGILSQIFPTSHSPSFGRRLRSSPYNRRLSIDKKLLVSSVGITRPCDSDHRRLFPQAQAS